MRKRSSRIWSVGDEDFVSVVESARVRSDIFKFFGMAEISATWLIIQKRCAELGIGSELAGLGFRKSKAPLGEMLIENSPYRYSLVKSRLIAEGLLENLCQICRIDPIWNGMPLVLRMDHINGVRDDHRLQNLRLICGNCDSQLPTFAGGNKVKKQPTTCIDCKTEICCGGARCSFCHRKNIFLSEDRTHAKWPPLEEFKKLLSEHGQKGVADLVGVAQSSVSERVSRIKKYGLW